MDVNYKVCPNDVNEGVTVAKEVLHDIIESAMDFAIKGTYAEDTLDNSQDVNPEIKQIIDGLSRINVSKSPMEEPLTLDLETKRLLSDMMSDTAPRKNGVGDQPPCKHDEQQVEEEPRQRIVEKKSRVTDLVMNSKRVLNNLLDEEERKKQGEWEEHNEEVIQVYDLQDVPRDETLHSPDIPPENVPLPQDNDDDLLIPNDDVWMESVELTRKGGEGDDLISQPDISKSIQNVQDAPKSRKKKLWTFFKFLATKKNRSKVDTNN